MPIQPLILIGGIDPSTHAGLFADARVVSKLNHPYRCIVTALTAQNDSHFFTWGPSSPKVFRQSLASLGPRVSYVKIGMVGNLSHIQILSAWLKKVRPKQVIWDPVLHSTSGGSLMQAKAWNQSLQDLLKQCTLLTPNFDEALWILGKEGADTHALEPIAQNLFEKASGKLSAILLKGGHAPKTHGSKKVFDILADASGIHSFSHERLSKKVRGTGCTLATAILVYLSQGKDLREAYLKAYRFTKNLLWG